MDTERNQKDFLLRLRVLPGRIRPGWMPLRGLCKVALRRFGLRAVDVRPATTPDDEPTDSVKKSPNLSS